MIPGAPRWDMSLVTVRTTAAAMEMAWSDFTGVMFKVTKALDDFTGVFCTPTKEMLVLVVGRHSTLAAWVDTRVMDDPESNRALTMSVLPPGPCSLILLVIMRMSGTFGVGML